MKALAIIAGIVLGVLICVAGFSMVGPEEDAQFIFPVRSGIAALVGLPLGYFLLVRPVAPWKIGAVFAIAMLSALAAAWFQLARSDTLYSNHLASMWVWSALWFTAAMPFIRTAFRR